MKKLKREYLAALGKSVDAKTAISILNENVIVSEKLLNEMKKKKLVDEYGEISEDYRKEIDILAQTNRLVKLFYVGKFPPVTYGIHFFDKEAVGVIEIGDLFGIEEDNSQMMLEVVRQYLGDSKFHHEVLIKLPIEQALIISAMIDIQRKYNMHALIVEEDAISYKGITQEDIEKFINDSHYPNWQWLSMTIKNQIGDEKIDFNFKDTMKKLIETKVVIQRNANEYALGPDFAKLVMNAFVVQNMVKIASLEIEDKTINSSELICLQFGIGDLLGIDVVDKQVMFASLTVDNLVEHFNNLIVKEGVL